MHRAALSLLLILTPFSLTAQTGAPASGSPDEAKAAAGGGVAADPAPPGAGMPVAGPVVLRLYGTPSGCPVGMRVQRTGGGAVMFTGGKNAGVSQRIHVSFGDAQPRIASAAAKKIVAAQVTVHGYSAEARAMPAADTDRSGAIEQTVNLNFAAGRGAVADVQLQSFAAVSRVDLESLTYADGTSWSAGGQGVCAVEPERLVLVAGR